jgi:hypothetical protein
MKMPARQEETRMVRARTFTERGGRNQEGLRASERILS